MSAQKKSGTPASIFLFFTIFLIVSGFFPGMSVQLLSAAEMDYVLPSPRIPDQRPQQLSPAPRSSQESSQEHLPAPRIPSADQQQNSPGTPRTASIVIPNAIPASDPRLQNHELEGLASWYGGKFQGRLTANGEVFNTNELTAAHKTLPFNTIVIVENTVTGQTVQVRINDRGPFVENRIIDLSRAAADAIDMAGSGVAPVRLHVLHFEEVSPYRTVQIGSFGDPDNAEQLVLELGRAGLSPTIEHASGGIHRVIIQNVHQDELEDTLARLAQNGYSQVLVRQN